MQYECEYRYYCLSILDKHHHPDISYEQGLKILRMCTDELKRRLPIDFKGVRILFPFFSPLKIIPNENAFHLALELVGRQLAD